MNKFQISHSFEMAYFGKILGHSRLVQVYKGLCDSKKIMHKIDSYEVDPKGFIETSQFIKKNSSTHICVTVPYKVEAFKICDHLTQRAQIAGSVNVIKNQNGKLIGHNTDGDGFIIASKKNHDIEFKNKSVLILGSGGVARGLIQPLAEEEPSTLDVSARNYEKLDLLHKDFRPYLNHSYLFSEIPHQPYDIIINATSASIQDCQLPLPSSIISSNTVCLECAYKWGGETPFAYWAKKNGADIVLDGVQMLIEQAVLAIDYFENIQVDSSKLLPSAF